MGKSSETRWWNNRPERRELTRRPGWAGWVRWWTGRRSCPIRIPLRCWAWKEEPSASAPAETTAEAITWRRVGNVDILFPNWDSDPPHPHPQTKKGCSTAAVFHWTSHTNTQTEEAGGSSLRFLYNRRLMWAALRLWAQECAPCRTSFEVKCRRGLECDGDCKSILPDIVTSCRGWSRPNREKRSRWSLASCPVCLSLRLSEYGLFADKICQFWTDNPPVIAHLTTSDVCTLYFLNK